MKKFSNITLSLAMSTTALFAAEDMIVNLTEETSRDNYYVLENPVGFIEQNFTVNVSGETYQTIRGAYYTADTINNFDGMKGNFIYNITGGTISTGLYMGLAPDYMSDYRHEKTLEGNLTVNVYGGNIDTISTNANIDKFTGDVYVNIHAGAVVDTIETSETHIGNYNVFIDGGNVRYIGLGTTEREGVATVTLVGSPEGLDFVSGADTVYIGNDSQAFSGSVGTLVSANDAVYISDNSTITTGRITSNKLYVGENADVTLSLLNNYYECEWYISSSAKISGKPKLCFGDGRRENFILNIVLDEDFDATSLNLSDIFEDTITFSGTMDETNFSLLDHNGNKLEGFELTTDETGSYIINNIVVPEPSTYAVIFGALTLAFAAYRRRK